MSFWSTVVLAYLVVRSVVAVALLWRAARRYAGAWEFAAQALADAIAVGFLAAYASYAVRATLGFLVIPLFACFVIWEAIAAVRRLSAMSESYVEPWSDAELVGGTLRWAWDICGIAPPFLAGAVLAFNILIPGQFALPGAPGPFECTPAALAAGDSVTLRMAVPHGSELGVFTPRRVFLSLVTAPPAQTMPPTNQFERQERFVVPGSVFADTGAYLITLTQYHDPSVTLTCTVHRTDRGSRDSKP